MTTTIAVVGASGFVGKAVAASLRARGCDVRPVRAPRFSISEVDAPRSYEVELDAVKQLEAQLAGCEVVVNCAGNPDASSTDRSALFGANAALPGVLAAASAGVAARRFVHVSSAAVQGAVPMLDDSDDTRAFSVYARSKIIGERSVRDAPSPTSTVIYRPPSVHSAERRVTRGIGRLARSPLSSVIGVGDAPTPQALINNVADAVAELAMSKLDPPPIVIHPSEGWTTAELMRAFGAGKEPRHLPVCVAGPIRTLLRLFARSSRLAPNARRVEMMWFGQAQDASWLTAVGWEPPAGRREWQQMIQRSQQPGSDGSNDLEKL